MSQDTGVFIGILEEATEKHPGFLFDSKEEPQRTPSLPFPHWLMPRPGSLNPAWRGASVLPLAEKEARLSREETLKWEEVPPGGDSVCGSAWSDTCLLKAEAGSGNP